jgi:hypothetical protein
MSWLEFKILAGPLLIRDFEYCPDGIDKIEF